MEALFHRLQLDVIYSAIFLHPVRRAESACCECGPEWENVVHLFLQCVRFNSQITALWERLNLLDKRTFAVSSVCSFLANNGTASAWISSYSGIYCKYREGFKLLVTSPSPTPKSISSSLTESPSRSLLSSSLTASPSLPPLSS